MVRVGSGLARCLRTARGRAHPPAGTGLLVWPRGSTTVACARRTGVRMETAGTPGSAGGQGSDQSSLAGASAVLPFATADLQPMVAHDGRGHVLAARVVEDFHVLSFTDLVHVPPNATIGRHTHGNDIELYVIVSGEAVVELDGVEHVVGPGDVAMNRPWGTHALRPTAGSDVRMVVVTMAPAVWDAHDIDPM